MPGKLALRYSALFLPISSETFHGLLTLCLCHRPSLSAVIHKEVHRVQRASCATTDVPIQKVYRATRGARRRVGLLALRRTRRSLACPKYQLRRFVYRNTEANGSGHYRQPEFSRSGRTSPCRCNGATRGFGHGNRTQIQGREGRRPAVSGSLDGQDSGSTRNAKGMLTGRRACGAISEATGKGVAALVFLKIFPLRDNFLLECRVNSLPFKLAIPPVDWRKELLSQ